MTNKWHFLKAGLFGMLVAVALPAFAETDCVEVRGKRTGETPRIECPSFPGSICPNQEVGPITNCVLRGEDPPLTLRPNLGNSVYDGWTGTVLGGKCPPGINPLSGKNYCPTFASPVINTIMSWLPTLPPLLNPLNYPNFTLANLGGLLPAMPCGGAVPLRVSGQLSLCNGLSVTPPSINDLVSTAVTSLFGKGACRGSMFNLPGNAIYALIPPTSTQININPNIGINTGTLNNVTDPVMTLINIPPQTFNPNLGQYVPDVSFDLDSPIGTAAFFPSGGQLTWRGYNSQGILQTEELPIPSNGIVQILARNTVNQWQEEATVEISDALNPLLAPQTKTFNMRDPLGNRTLSKIPLQASQIGFPNVNFAQQMGLTRLLSRMPSPCDLRTDFSRTIYTPTVPPPASR